MRVDGDARRQARLAGAPRRPRPSARSRRSRRVDEVDHRRNRQRRRRRRGPLADLDRDLGDDAVERRPQRHVSSCAAPARSPACALSAELGRLAASSGLLRRALHLVEQIVGEDAVCRERGFVRARGRALGGEAGALRLGAAALASRLAQVESARSRTASSCSSTSPVCTRSPLRFGSAMTRPPSCGDSFARRRAFTVPAREFVTVGSTVPRSTIATSTGTTLPRAVRHATRAAAATKTAATISQRRARDDISTRLLKLGTGYESVECSG